ncbi:MAG: sigma-70 family RNA polymerase sigma factor [Clostridia bacterium]|nr:sigma-70 family RNA polymerase sigma factor [Clostridia bacterium]
MKRKNYLAEELSKEEKLYLKRIVMTAKNKYIEKNYKYINSIDICLEDTIVKGEETVLDAVLQKCQEEITSAIEFEKTISNPSLYKIIKALSLREKEVLFYLYKKQKNIKETAKIMNIDRKTVNRIRGKVQKKIVENLVRGENKYV